MTTAPVTVTARAPATVLVAGAVTYFSVMLTVQFGLGLRLSDLMRDPAAVAAQPFYIGLGSHVGVLLWGAAATICLFSAGVLTPGSEAGTRRSFLNASGVLTLILALDDLFLLHEEVIPRFLGIPEMVVLGSYGLLVIAYLTRYRGVIARTDHYLLRLALTFFGLSLVLDMLPALFPDSSSMRDVLPPVLIDVHVLLEDGAKLFGIVSWLGYFGGASGSALRALHALHQQPPE